MTAPAGFSFITDAMVQPHGFNTPDNATTVWPAPHDPKIDCIEVLRIAFSRLGLGDIPLSKDGAFTAAQMKTPEGGSLPFVTVTRASDVAVRRGITNLIGVYAQGDPGLIDGSALVPPGGAAAVTGEYSQTTIDVTICDKNPHRADQIYQLVKLIMIAARREFTTIGYIDVKRINGSDSAKVEINDPTPYLLFTRTLTYMMDYPDYIVNVDALVHLIQQTLVLEPTSQDASITTDL